MSGLKVNSSAFYSNYIFHPFKKELKSSDKAKAFFTSASIFLATGGLFHVVCYIKYRNLKVSIGQELAVVKKIKTVSEPGLGIVTPIKPAIEKNKDGSLNIEALTKEGEAGNAEAQEKLYRYYRSGLKRMRTPDDYQKELYWKEKIVDKDPKVNIQYCSELAETYLKGELFTPQDFVKGRKYLLMAVRNHQPEILYPVIKGATIEDEAAAEKVVAELKEGR